MRKVFRRSLLVVSALLLLLTTLASAAYIGPGNRTVDSYVWERRVCALNYNLSNMEEFTNMLPRYVAPSSSCPSGSATMIEQGMDGSDYYILLSWPDHTFFGGSYTGAERPVRGWMPWTIINRANTNKIETCTSGQTGCTRRTVSVTYDPATVSGTNACTSYGNNGWCKGVGTLNLSSTEPYPGKTITAIETANETLCSGSSCTYTYPQGTTSLTYWAVSSLGDTSLQSTSSMSVDSVAPTANLSISGTLENGWYNGKSAIEFTTFGTDATSGVSDLLVIVAGGSAISSPVTYDGSDSSSLSVQGQVIDTAGNIGTSTTQTIKVDRTDPTITPYIVSGTLGNNGYYITSVTVGALTNDAMSGVKNYAPSSNVSFTTDGVHDQDYSITDNAGNVGTNSTTVRIDKTKPTASPAVTFGLVGLSGWYRSSITVAANASDATSGIAVVSPSSSVVLNTEGSNNVTFTVEDMAGNTDTFSLASPVMIDTVIPTINTNVTGGTPNAAGWYTANITLNANISDSNSGVLASATGFHATDSITGTEKSSTSSSISSLGEGIWSVETSAGDIAGNTNTATSNVKIDLSAPLFSPTFEGTLGLSGWYKSAVTVHAHASDAVSGIKSISPSADVTLSDEGENNLTFSATNNADLTSTHSIDAVHIDTVSPSMSPTIAGTSGLNNWYTSTVIVRGHATDSTSGVLIDPVLTFNDGIFNPVSLTAQDIAGNESTSTLADPIKVDKVAPSISPSITGTAGNNGWYLTDVTVDANATDATSGVLSSSSLNFTDGVHESVVLNAQDVAGNTKSVTLVNPIKIDTVKPSLSPTVSGTLGLNGWYISTVSLKTNATDATSGIFSNGNIILSDGTHSGVVLTAEDNAGNSKSVSLADTYNVDTISPVITFNALPAVIMDTVTLSGTVVDATSGLQKFEISKNGGLSWSDVTVEADGSWELADETLVFTATKALIVGRATDLAGNISTKNLVAQGPTPTSTTAPKEDGSEPWYSTPLPTQTTAGNLIKTNSTPTAIAVIEMTETPAPTEVYSAQLVQPTATGLLSDSTTESNPSTSNTTPLQKALPIAVTGVGVAGLAVAGIQFDWWKKIADSGIVLFLSLFKREEDE